MDRLLKYTIYLFFIIFPFGQLARFEFQNNISVVLIDAVVGIFAALWIFSLKSAQFRRPPFFSILIFFCGLALYSLIFNSFSVNINNFLVGLLYLARLIIYIIFYFGTYNLVQKKVLMPGQIINNFLLIGAIISVFGLIQYILIPDMRFLRGAGWDDHFYRLSGTFFDPTYIGIILVFFVLVAFAKKNLDKNISSILLGLIGIGCIALTFSRASYLALIAGLFVLFVIYKNWKVVILSIVVFFMALFLAPKPGGEGVNLQRTSTVISRFQNYEEALQIFQKSPVFGIGYNLYRAQRIGDTINLKHSGAGADSSILFLLATTGVVGLMVFAQLGLKLVEFGFKNINQSEGVILLSSISALTVHSIFSNSIFYSWVLGWVVLLLASIKASKL